MAFFNNYQSYYNPMYNQPYANALANTGQFLNQNGTKIYVQGEAAAKSYLVAPNASVVLWDSERPIFYEKYADTNGMPTLKRFRFVEDSAETPQESVSEVKVDYVTKEDLNAVYGQISDLRTELEGLSIRRPSKKKEVTDDE